MTSDTFPDYDMGQYEPMTAKDTAIRDAEKLLVGYATYNLNVLDHIGSLKPHHFSDDDLGTIFRRLLAERAAGCVDTDPALVAPELPEIASSSDLERFERLAPSVKPERIAGIVSKVIEGWQGREVRSRLAKLAFEDAPVAEVIEAARRRLDHIEAAVPARAAGSPFAVIPVSSLIDQEAPTFIWEGLIPANHVTLLAAHGGTGKSLVALLLAVSVAMDLPLFNVPTRQGPVVFFSGEDDGPLLRHRLRSICDRMSINPVDLDGKLHLIDATAHDPVLFSQPDRSKSGTTPTYDALRAYVREVKPVLLILDNASDVFAGSEIDRTAVRAFMRHAALLGRDVGAAVLLLAHVDKTTSRGSGPKNTEGYSGSTAWSNSARSRLFMSRAEDGSITLEHQKSNLGKLRDPIRLFWPEGGLPQVDEEFGPVVQGIADRNHEKVLLKLIHEYTQRGEHVSSATTSRTHAAKLLKHEPTYPARLKDAEVFDLLRRCERTGYLERINYKGADRKPRERWSVTKAGMDFAGINAATAATAATK